MFNDIEIDVINKIEDLLPIARLDEYLIINQVLKEDKIDLKRLEGINSHITNLTLKNAHDNLVSLNIVNEN